MYFWKYSRYVNESGGLKEFFIASLGYILYLVLNSFVAAAFGYVFEVRERMNLFGEAELENSRELYTSCKPFKPETRR